MTAVCIATPKACFGSCPTFYLDPAGPILAEGFSRSIARTLEATDIDALGPHEADAQETVSVWMKNEAPETHVVRHVRLLAVPAEGAVARSADGRFLPIRTAIEAASCRSADGDCGPALAEADAAEYRVPTDPHDLAAPDEIELSFRAPRGAATALVIRARTSLVETYVFYQLLAWMGLRADDWILELERGGDAGRQLIDSVIGALSRIEVDVRRGGSWQPLGAFDEVGPLAWDELALIVPDDLGSEEVEFRLRMARGAWRIDRVALAEVSPAADPIRLDVQRVSRGGLDVPQAAERLGGRGGHLVTYPGDSYRLEFQPPPGPHQLFLESRGYYYEWVRQSWVGEENEEKLVNALVDPRAALRALAPEFKRVEPVIEDLFWRSRVEAR